MSYRKVNIGSLELAVFFPQDLARKIRTLGGILPDRQLKHPDAPMPLPEGTHSREAQALHQRLDKIESRVRESFPGGSHLFLSNIYDPTDGDGDTEHAGLPAWPEGVPVLQAYNSALRRFADTHPHVTLIDLRAEFLGHGIHCTHFWRQDYHKAAPYYWYWENLEDPNDQGYDAIRRLFLKEISRVVPGKLAEP